MGCATPWSGGNTRPPEAVSDTPLVSVCIPTRNRAGWLSHAIASVLAQTFADFEIVVSDNASTDGTAETVNGFGDRRIQYARHEDGVVMAQNWLSAIARAQGKYLAILADDDWWHPEFLTRTSEALQRDKDASVAFSDHWLVDQNDALLESDTEAAARERGRATLAGGRVDFIKSALLDQALLTTSSLFLRETFPDLSPLVENGPTIPANYIFGWLALSGYAAVYVPDRLAYYRSHATSATLSATLQTLQDYRWASGALIRQFSPPQPARGYIARSLALTVSDQAALLLRKGEWAKARKTYAHLIRLRPWSARAWLGLGASLPGARRCYQTIRHRGPDS
jgi:glycosyltransferase involved in cell wall biosynthesis